MTRDEAHRRAIEAAEDAFLQSCKIKNLKLMEIAITAYLAAMVLPISQAEEEQDLLVFSELHGWEVFYKGSKEELEHHCTAFTFLPEPPK